MVSHDNFVVRRRHVIYNHTMLIRSSVARERSIRFIGPTAPWVGATGGGCKNTSRPWARRCMYNNACRSKQTALGYFSPVEQLPCDYWLIATCDDADRWWKNRIRVCYVKLAFYRIVCTNYCAWQCISALQRPMTIHGRWGRTDIKWKQHRNSIHNTLPCALFNTYIITSLLMSCCCCMNPAVRRLY